MKNNLSDDSLNRNLILAIFAALLVLSLACGGQSGEPAATAPEAAEPSAQAGEAEEVEFEPAYPTDVSDEELSEEDKQQQKTHSHGGAEHSHDGEDSHSHGEDAGHTHGDSGDHSH